MAAGRGCGRAAAGTDEREGKGGSVLSPPPRIDDGLRTGAQPAAVSAVPHTAHRRHGGARHRPFARVPPRSSPTEAEKEAETPPCRSVPARQKQYPHPTSRTILITSSRLPGESYLAPHTPHLAAKEHRILPAHTHANTNESEPSGYQDRSTSARMSSPSSSPSHYLSVQPDHHHSLVRRSSSREHAVTSALMGGGGVFFYRCVLCIHLPAAYVPISPQISTNRSPHSGADTRWTSSRRD